MITYIGDENHEVSRSQRHYTYIDQIFKVIKSSSLSDHPRDEEEDEQLEEEEDEDGLRFSNAGSYSCSDAVTFILQGFVDLYR